MTGQSGGPSLIQRQPIGTATGVTSAVTAILVAFWSVASDYGWFSALQPQTVLLVNAAIIIVVNIIANAWAQRHSTSTLAPKIQSGTTVVTTDDKGTTTGTTTV